MTKKQVLTNADIEKDIINALRQSKKVPKIYNKKTEVILSIVIVIGLVLMILYPYLLIGGALALVMFVILRPILMTILLNHRAKKVSIDDYEIRNEILSHKNIKKIHIRLRGKGASRIPVSTTISIYILNFENGKSWYIPRDCNYAWSVEHSRSDLAIYQESHREDSFIVVTKKDTGKIVMAYHTKLFEYRNPSLTL